jgi:hypothetical protein
VAGVATQPGDDVLVDEKAVTRARRRRRLRRRRRQENRGTGGDDRESEKLRSSHHRISELQTFRLRALIGLSRSGRARCATLRIW